METIDGTVTDLIGIKWGMIGIWDYAVLLGLPRSNYTFTCNLVKVALIFLCVVGRAFPFLTLANQWRMVAEYRQHLLVLLQR